jgi:hypothetical protein
MTSIEYLFNELWDTPKDKFEWHAILDKAKQDHKKEIIDAHVSGYNDAGAWGEEFYGEKYYYITFEENNHGKRN